MGHDRARSDGAHLDCCDQIAAGERRGIAKSATARKWNALPLRALQLVPACARTFEIVRGCVEKEHKRCRARKAIESMVVGVGPIEGTVRLDLDPGVKTNRVVIIELSLHSAWAWYHRLPYALAGHCRRAGRNQ
jgi:hypothetical protein